ncbi:MAG: anaerobic ribonucleoside-triphosphate reductase activating protein [Bacteroidetes bacterium]|nr:MAG: anaerobic ribonucleoside-triphosphate reductase activating protein [Bacteroidota bacterium]PIE87944.1 MAG: anaerobic ribonucleoside-triphosphate reductase activating protein [Bacteroidota bacterium]
MLKYVDYDIVFREIPDEVTLAINLSNCPNRCKGCHSPWLMDDVGDPLTEEVLAGMLKKYGRLVTCICFMGGDIAPSTVTRLAAFVRQESQGRIKTGWYSGRDQLAAQCDLSCFNFVKIGSYREQLGGLDVKTTNQRLYKVSPEMQLTDITFRMQN